MLKKLNILIICLFITGCPSSKINMKGGSDFFTTDYDELSFNANDKDAFRVGMLLPLTGSAAKHGVGLKNAAMMALDDVKNDKMILQFYDTKSSPEGARTAVENALSQRSQLILGPLTSVEVEAISGRATSRNIPVIAFTTSKDVLRPSIYTLGLLIDEQVDRIMTYASDKGKRRFAILIPDNSMGTSVAKAAIASANKNGVEVSRIAYYPPNTTDFADIIKRLTDYGSSGQAREKTLANLQLRADAGDVSAKNQLNYLKSKGGRSVDFDAVLIPEYGTKLKAIVAMFGYYDVYAPQVKFLGTSIWENTNLNKESMIMKSWYPTLSRSHSAYFSNKYAEYFGERPNSLFSFAYDGVALASALSTENKSSLNAAITDPEGYIGINGAFRLFANGTNQHSLDIMEIRTTGDTVVNAAPKSFTDKDRDFYTNPNYFNNRPLILGKDPALAEMQIFGVPTYNSYW